MSDQSRLLFALLCVCMASLLVWNDKVTAAAWENVLVWTFLILAGERPLSAAFGTASVAFQAAKARSDAQAATASKAAS